MESNKKMIKFSEDEKRKKRAVLFSVQAQGVPMRRTALLLSSSGVL